MDTFLQDNPELQTSIKEWHSTSLGYALNTSEEYRSHILNILTGIERAKDNPEQLTNSLTQWKKAYSRKPSDDPDVIALQANLRKSDKLFFVVRDEVGWVVIRDGRIVYVNLSADGPGGLENMNEL